MGSASRQTNLLGLQKEQLADLVSKKTYAYCIDNVSQITYRIGATTYGGY
jgi:hypothetical protein